MPMPRENPSEWYGCLAVMVAISVVGSVCFSLFYMAVLFMWRLLWSFFE